MADPDIKQLVIQLFNKGAIKLGKFTLKTGVISPIYIDLRILVSYSHILRDVSKLLLSRVEKSNCKYDIICGVPYTALPIATCISLMTDIPMVMRRKEEKNYGTKQMIEGIYQRNEKVLIIEDVMSSGASILETAICLYSNGLKVTDAVVFIDREHFGYDNLKKFGITVHCVIKICEALQILKNNLEMLESDLNIEQINEAIEWIKTNPAMLDRSIINQCQLINYNNFFRQPSVGLKERAKLCQNDLAKQLFLIMEKKQSNLCVAVDLVESEKILQLINNIGPYICLLKTHIDIINNYDANFILKLKELAKKFEFLIFEDRKFSDIGRTVTRQFNDGIYKISQWADVVTAHIVSGPGVIDGLKKNLVDIKNKGCFLVAQMSSKGSLTVKSYSKAAYDIATSHSDFVIGFISQSKIASDLNFLHMTPGVNISKSNDPIDQQYISPEEAVLQRGADIIIVGSGIIEADDPVESAILYQKRAYQALINRSKVNATELNKKL